MIGFRSYTPSASVHRQVLVAVALVLLVPLILHAQPSPHAGRPNSFEDFVGRMDDQVPVLLNDFEIPGAAIALIKDGKPVWAEAYGYADRRNEQKLTVNTTFRAESISKSVTAWGIMTLLERTSLNLDDPAQKHLGPWSFPPSPFDEDAITVQGLLSNSAGLGLVIVGEEYPPETPTPSLRSYLRREAKLVQPPGSGFRYSNAGYNVLELLVEEQTGHNFDAYMREAVLDPLGMRFSSYTLTDSLRSQLATGYDLQATRVAPYVYPARASGGLITTVNDVARFVAAGMTGVNTSNSSDGLTTESIRALHTPRVPITGLFGVVADAYGFGHFVEELPDGRRAVWHGGQGHGWMTHFHSVPSSGDGIVILTNSQRSWPFIANILSTWSTWSGVGDVKMTRITTARTVLRLLCAGLSFVVMGWSAWLIWAVYRGTRSLAPLSRAHVGRRLALTFVGLAILGGLAWSAAQPYLMVQSIFPTTAGPVGGVLLLAGLVSLATALIPSVD